MTTLNGNDNKPLPFEQSIFEKLKDAEREARMTEKRFSITEVYSSLIAIIRNEL